MPESLGTGAPRQFAFSPLAGDKKLHDLLVAMLETDFLFGACTLVRPPGRVCDVPHLLHRAPLLPCFLGFCCRVSWLLSVNFM